MNTVWMLVLAIVHTGMTTVPVAYPTKAACVEAGEAAKQEIGTVLSPLRYSCLPRNGDR